MASKARTALAVLAVVLAYGGIGYWWGTQMPLALSIGSGSIALVQNGAVQETLISTATPIPITLPVASTAGSFLLAAIGTGNPGAVPSITNMPTGWVNLTAAIAASATDWEFWGYPNNPGGIVTVSPTANCGVGGARWYTHMSEWSGVLSASYLETSGTATATAGTILVPTTTATLVASRSLVVAGWMQQVAASATNVFTSPTGFTRLIDTSSLTRFQHLDIEYATNVAPGAPLGVTLTSDTASTQAASGVIVLKAKSVLTDMTAYIREDSQELSLNQAEFGLMLGGRYLLESVTAGSAPDGYQLEDGSGVLLLDTYTPQLGDPVTYATPSWSGRVVSVQQQDIVDMLTNYKLVTVAASNTALASATPAAPGDFSDVATGGYYLLESGAPDRYLLEDETGDLVLEGSTFPYRNLSLAQSQNQDGTTTTNGSLETFETGFAAGQAITITSANLGLVAAAYTITNVRIRFIGVGTPMYTVEFGDTPPTLQTSGGGVLTRTANQATQQLGVAQPAGLLGTAQITADFGTFTAVTDVTGLSVTVTVASGRRLVVSCQCQVASSGAGDRLAVFIRESGTTLAFATYEAADAGIGYGNVLSVPLQPSAGVHTYNVSASRDSGAGNVTAKASATNPAWIMVEDVGT